MLTIYRHSDDLKGTVDPINGQAMTNIISDAFVSCNTRAASVGRVRISTVKFTVFQQSRVV